MDNSPCVKICKLEETKTYCVGCGRRVDEIKDWANKDPLERRFIAAKARARLDTLKSTGRT